MIRFLALIAFTTTVFAQPYEKVLLPVQPSQIDGAFGSKWHTMAAAHSDDDREVALKCFPAACVPLAAHGSYLLQANARQADPAFVYVPADQAAAVVFALRTIATAADGSRITMEIPVARERDFTGEVFHLQAVPVEARSRLALRIFDLDAVDGSKVRVRIHTGSANAAVDETLTLHVPATPPVDGLPAAPAYTAIHDLVNAFPALGATELVYIDIEPLTPGLKIWAFVSATDKVTQQFNHFIN